MTTVEVVAAGGPEGDAKCAVVLESGRDATLTLTVPFTDAAAIARGELDPSVAYMQGRLKAAGDTGALLNLLSRWESQDAGRLRDELRTMTEA